MKQPAKVDMLYIQANTKQPYGFKNSFLKLRLFTNDQYYLHESM